MTTAIHNQNTTKAESHQLYNYLVKQHGGFSIAIGVIILILGVALGTYYLTINLNKSDVSNLQQTTPNQAITNDNAPILLTITPTSTQNSDLVAAPSNIPTTNGVDLKDIKYTLPQGWEARLSDKQLLITPINGGGLLGIKVYDYPGTIGRREYFCQITKYCIEGTTYFKETTLGNISGYIANAIDNSGGGAEYFGAKGNKFYKISTYNPPSPNEFEKNFKNILNSLIF